MAAYHAHLGGDPCTTLCSVSQTEPAWFDPSKHTVVS